MEKQKITKIGHSIMPKSSKAWVYEYDAEIGLAIDMLVLVQHVKR